MATQQPPSPETPGALEHELKYRLDPSRVALALAWLAARCRPEGAHADNRVVSVYYDTPRLALLQESLCSDWAKTKVRLRWYEPIAGGPPGGAFLEVKDRFGKRRKKRRIPVPDGEALTRLPLDHPAFRDVLALLPAELAVPRSGLVPILATRYRRRRFADRASDARLSVDSEITVAKTNRSILHAADPRPLRVALVEVKTVHADLPRSLHGLLALGLKLESFSKYRVAWEAARSGTAAVA